MANSSLFVGAQIRKLHWISAKAEEKQQMKALVDQYNELPTSDLKTLVTLDVLHRMNDENESVYWQNLFLANAKRIKLSQSSTRKEYEVKQDNRKLNVRNARTGIFALLPAAPESEDDGFGSASRSNSAARANSAASAKSSGSARRSGRANSAASARSSVSANSPVRANSAVDALAINRMDISK